MPLKTERKTLRLCSWTKGRWLKLGTWYLILLTDFVYAFILCFFIGVFCVFLLNMKSIKMFCISWYCVFQLVSEIRFSHIAILLLNIDICRYCHDVSLVLSFLLLCEDFVSCSVDWWSPHTKDSIWCLECNWYSSYSVKCY